MKQYLISSVLVFTLVVFAGNSASAHRYHHYCRPHYGVRVCAPVSVYVPPVRYVAPAPVAYYGPGYCRPHGYYRHAYVRRPHYYRRW